MTVVVHVQDSAPAPLHAEVLLPDGMHLVSATSDGECIFNGCNAVGESLTMTETVALDRLGTFVVTGYASDGTTATTQPYTVTVAPLYRFYLP